MPRVRCGFLLRDQTPGRPGESSPDNWKFGNTKGASTVSALSFNGDRGIGRYPCRPFWFLLGGMCETEAEVYCLRLPPTFFSSASPA